MTAVLVALLLAISVLIAALALSYGRNERLNNELHEERDVNHAKCIAHITSYVGDQFAASVLRAAAKDWDSVEEIPRMKRLARERYQVGGPSMPVIWLTDRADRMTREEES